MTRDSHFGLLEAFDALNERKRRDPASLTKIEKNRWRVMRCQIEEALFQRPRDPAEDAREFLRVPVSLQVRYKLGAKAETRYVSILGEDGISIATPEPAPKGTVIDLEVTPLGFGSAFSAKGEVVWTSARQNPADRGMGIRFTQLTVAQKEAIYTLVDDNLRQHLLERRHYARIDTRVPVRVEIGGRGLDLTTQNLCLGGLFVTSEQLPKVGDMASLRLRMPGGHPEIRASGWIAHTVFKLASGHAPGFGLVLEGLGIDDQLNIQNYIINRVTGKTRHPADEPRRHARLKRRIKLRFQASNAFGTSDASDISGGGFFLQSREPPPLHSTIEVTLTHPASLQTLNLSGRVVRIVPAFPPRPGLVPGVGVAFHDLSALSTDLLQGFLKDFALAECASEPKDKQPEKE